MRTYLKWILLLACFFELTSCTSLSHQQSAPTQNQTAIPENRVTVLSNIKSWDLKGLIAIRNAKDAWSANWQWTQNPKDYTINLVGPLGSQSIQLTGSPHSVQLETSDGKKFQSDSPESLLEKQLGWRLPVSSLYYWIRGLPVPSLPAEKQFDSANRLTVLVQQGWRIEYLRYSTVNQIDLPGKMVLNNALLNVKIIVNEWKIKR
ncbi:MAG TPA: lipoprotein insertase outer membrane protein LolB [Gammaproteobacteria bacterium]|nr:lipoprotein insertase outer membrane protein LolB [Gammaproteobacteria bacterium]